MRKFIIIFFSLILANCSLNKDSQYWTENSIENKNNQKKLSQILKKADDITSMTLEEYEIYIDDYTKKSKYPDFESIIILLNLIKFFLNNGNRGSNIDVG